MFLLLRVPFDVLNFGLHVDNSASCGRKGRMNELPTQLSVFRGGVAQCQTTFCLALKTNSWKISTSLYSTP